MHAHFEEAEAQIACPAVIRLDPDSLSAETR